MEKQQKRRKRKSPAAERGRSLERQPLHQREAQLLKRMRTVGKLPVATIARIAERNKTQVYKALSGKLVFAKRGPKDKLQPKDVNRMVRVLKDMIRTARARWEITLAMLKRRAKIKADDKVVRKALLKKKIKFRRLRSKPVLTKDDIKARWEFAKEYRHKTEAWWRNHIQLFIDLKNFPVYTNAKSRDIAAMRQVRGAYRARGEGLDAAYVVLPKELRHNPGAKPCRIAAGVGGGRVRLWSEIGTTWTGKAAAEMYSGPLLSALKRGWPNKRSYRILEDNDPTGFKSKQGEAAKRKCKISVFKIPERSPDLSVCDYAIWNRVNRTMRRQEKKWARSKKETRSQYIKRLHDVAKALPKTFINDSIGSMVKRCNRLYKAKGGLFEEGR